MEGRSGSGDSKKLNIENARLLSTLAQQIEDLVYAVSERSFFFKQLEGRNRRSFDNAVQDDDGRDLTGYDFASDGLEGFISDEGRNCDIGESSPEDELKVAWRYRMVREMYTSARAHKKSANPAYTPVLPAEQEASLAAIEAVDALTDNWLSTADEVLTSVWQYEGVLDRLPCVTVSPEESDVVFQADPSILTGTGFTKTDINVLVTNGELIPTIAKLLLFGLAKHFHPTCIYSSRDCGKVACFQEIAKRFSGAGSMVAVGDGQEEELAAARCGMLFVKINCAQDLRQVRYLSQARRDQE